MNKILKNAAKALAISKNIQTDFYEFGSEFLKQMAIQKKCLEIEERKYYRSLFNPLSIKKGKITESDMLHGIDAEYEVGNKAVRARKASGKS
jgi:hypothetical protein